MRIPMSSGFVRQAGGLRRAPRRALRISTTSEQRARGARAGHGPAPQALIDFGKTTWDQA
jgi:hypothetical protein